jgi:indolepyruvate ferredoxin oxidoreductase beta subunit
VTGARPASPITVLIAALGGEGGGVLTGWIVDAAEKAGYPVQATSIPGVAQRTGATTYYLEVWPETREALGDRRPVLSLAPAIGEVDILAASELLETGRAIRSGFVTPDRTLLVASTHRFFTTLEKMAMGDGRVDADALRQAAAARSRARIMFDMEQAAVDAGAPLSAVLLGAIAGSGRLPVPADAFRDAIRDDGRSVDANLRGFDAGFAVATEATTPVEAPPVKRLFARVDAAALLARAHEEFPAALRETLDHAIRRLVDYQGVAYAALYLDRLQPFRGGDLRLLRSVARHLAVRMSFEDAIRVAQAKTRPGRIARIRAEAGADAEDAIVVTEFFKPGLREICDILPRGLARWVLARAATRPRLRDFHKGMELHSTTLWGYGRLRLLARLRRFRPSSWRYAEEQAAIEDWLAMVADAAGRGTELAVEVAECARLIKGYGGTHRRGTANFNRIAESLIRPALAGRIDISSAPSRIAGARSAALADPEGAALDDAIDGATAASNPSPGGHGGRGRILETASQ